MKKGRIYAFVSLTSLLAIGSAIMLGNNKGASIFPNIMFANSVNDYYHYAGFEATCEKAGLHDYYTNCVGSTELDLPQGATVVEERTLTQEQIDIILSDESDPRVIPALQHDVSHVIGQPATGKYDGVIDHYHCGRCGKNYSDEECTIEIAQTVDPCKGVSFTAGTAKGVLFEGISLAAMANKTFAIDLKFINDGQFVINLKDRFNDGSWQEKTLTPNTTFTKSGDSVSVTRGAIEKMTGTDGENGWYTYYINDESLVGDGYSSATNLSYFYYRGGDTCTSSIEVDFTSARLIDKVYKHGVGTTFAAGNPDKTFVGINNYETRTAVDLDAVKAVSFDFYFKNGTSATLSARSATGWPTLIGEINVSRNEEGVYSTRCGSLTTYSDGWANIIINANEFTGDGWATATSKRFDLMSIRNFTAGEIIVDFATIHACEPYYAHNNTSVTKITAGTSNADKGNFTGNNLSVKLFNIEDCEAVAIDMKLDVGAQITFGMKSKEGTKEGTLIRSHTIKNVDGVVKATSYTRADGGYTVTYTQNLNVVEGENGWVTLVINNNQFNGDGYNLFTNHPVNYIVLRNATGGNIYVDYSSVRMFNEYRARNSESSIHVNANTRADAKFGGLDTYLSRSIEFATAEAASFDIKLDGDGQASVQYRYNGSVSYLENKDVILQRIDGVYSMKTGTGSVVTLADGWARVIINKSDLRQDRLQSATEFNYVTMPDSNTVGYTIDLSSFQVCSPHS